MTATAEQDALLEAVFAAPADDTPRLVYADWLDEHSEPDYAAFIRTQIELAKLTDPAKRAPPLEKRETGLWIKLKKKWRDLTQVPVFNRRDLFKRGFPHGAAELNSQMPADRFVEVADRLWPRLPLRWVSLHADDKVPDTLLEHPYLRRLTRLELTFGRDPFTVIPEAFAVRLFACRAFDRLVGLDVTRVPLTRRVADALRAAPYLKRLKRLVVRFVSSSDPSRSYCSEELRFPHNRWGFNGTGLAKNPGGAGAMLAKQLPWREPELLVAPPDETSIDAILEHTARARGL